MKLLKKRVLASTMSILTLSSLGQLISFADSIGKETPVYAIKGENVHFDSLELPKIKEVLGSNKNDIETLEVAKKIVSTLGIDTFEKLIEIDGYNIQIDFGSMESVINEVNENLEITNWDCKNNTVQITNHTTNSISAHIGIEFDETCGIQDIELDNAVDLSNVEIESSDVVNRRLELTGGKISTNANKAILDNLYEQGNETKIGTAKVFITDNQVAKSIKAAAEKLKAYANNTKKLADQLSTNNNETKEATEKLVGAANNLTETRKTAKKEYKNNVNKFVKALETNHGRLNGIELELGYNHDLSTSVQNFIDANNELTQIVTKNTEVAADVTPTQPESTSETTNNNNSDDIKSSTPTQSESSNSSPQKSSTPAQKESRKLTQEQKRNLLSRSRRSE